MGFSSSPNLSALDQYRTSGKPSVRYWSLGLINRVTTKTPCKYLYLLHTYYRLHSKITLGYFNTGPFFATLMAQSRDCAKNPYNMGFWHCLSILAPLQSVAIEIECSACTPYKIKNGRRKKNKKHSKHCQTDFWS